MDLRMILASNKHFAVNHFHSDELTSCLTPFLRHFVCYIEGISDKKMLKVMPEMRDRLVLAATTDCSEPP